MLINLDKWRKEGIEKKLLSAILSKHGKIQQGEQETLNAVLLHDIFCFEHVDK